MQADYEERQASQSNKFTFNQNIKQPATGTAPGAGRSTREAAPAARKQQRNGTKAQTGSAAEGVTSASAPEVQAGGKRARPQMLSFGDEEEDNDG